ncbi:prenyltransferase/squalene oxidase repeat-containing protein [Prosthecobacter sp.]|uniref:prenyltransferase/squalene oxidase repeat-containing protein n=1 Tax=Prosthecobacter sp. TaxID=1965333 RepID=UPI00378459A6
MKPAYLLLLVTSSAFAADAPKPKAEFQYQTEGIQISRATADEPKVKAFGPETIKAAAKYLDDGAICWVREKTCVNCHTTGPYLSERPALAKQLGMPLEEVLADFVKTVPAEVKPQKETEKDGIKYFGGSWTSIWRSMGLAEWDKHITGSLSPHTERSLQEMFARQSANGSFVSFGEVEIPHITTDFELTLQAARAMTAAPGWLAGLKDPELLAKVEKMKSWLRTAEPKNDFDRILRLQLAFYLPDVVPQPLRDEALALLSSKQHADGGWSLRDMSALNDWHFKISDTVVKLVTSLPDAAKPESDAYMTAFAIVLMRQNNIPASDERIQRALKWLKQEQRVSGRWWMQSLYRGNYSYITYIATAQAMKALALCDELR